MLLFLRLLAAFFLTCLGSCGHVIVKSPDPRNSAPADDQSWSSFRKALENKDVSKIASKIDFPLPPTGLEGMDGFEGIGTLKRFDPYFSTLFPEDAVRTLLGFSPGREDIGARNWTVVHSDRAVDSEMESTISYHFVLSSDGRVRLKSIQFAG